MSILGIIPSRYASTRFPGKPLVEIAGKTMIRRVYEQAIQASCLGKLIVATDHHDIYEEVKSFSGNVIMTSPEHLNGTERCAEVAKQFPDFDAIINIQGDEPFVQPDQIDQLGSLLDEKTEIATLVKKVSEEETLHDPNEIKVVFNLQHEAMYFSRSAIPFERNVLKNRLTDTDYYKHIGLYGYRSDILQRLSGLKPTPAEKAEYLEQLRWLEHGYKIKLGFTDLDSQMIDTKEDLLKLDNRLMNLL